MHANNAGLVAAGNAWQDPTCTANVACGMDESEDWFVQMGGVHIVTLSVLMEIDQLNHRSSFLGSQTTQRAVQVADKLCSPTKLSELKSAVTCALFSQTLSSSMMCTGGMTRRLALRRTAHLGLWGSAWPLSTSQRESAISPQLFAQDCGLGIAGMMGKKPAERKR